MAQTSTVQAPPRSDVIDNLRLARGRVESAEWYATRPDLDDSAAMVRSLAETAIYALQEVIDAVAQQPRELRRPADVTERLEADL